MELNKTGLNFSPSNSGKNSNICCPSTSARLCWQIRTFIFCIRSWKHLSSQKQILDLVTINMGVKSHFTVTCVNSSVFWVKVFIWRVIEEYTFQSPRSLYFINYTCSVIQEVLSLPSVVFGEGGSMYLDSGREIMCNCYPRRITFNLWRENEHLFPPRVSNSDEGPDTHSF